jgi:hypothetical protein
MTQDHLGASSGKREKHAHAAPEAPKEPAKVAEADANERGPCVVSVIPDYFVPSPNRSPFSFNRSPRLSLD